MREFESIDTLKSFLSNKVVEEIVVQSLDLKEIGDLVLESTFHDCIFLGCQLSDKIWNHLSKDNYIFPTINAPYNIYPNRLYNRFSLYNGYDYKNPKSYNKTLDKIIYSHYLKTGKSAQIFKETLSRRLHDHSITDALQEFLAKFEEKKVVAIMGGHGLSRNSDRFKKVAFISKELAEKGYLMISGGGPGAMEATHLGAWFGGDSNENLNDAISMLSIAPTYNHDDGLPTAFQVIEKYPNNKFESLGIPTWLYGHEPATPFATHIAKYFANSVREEGLLAIAKGGIIFAPGSAGTIQEIFQDITQNHYESFGYASPMVFLDKTYWCYDRPVYPVIELMKLRGNLKNLDIGVYDSNKDIIDHIQSFT